MYKNIDTTRPGNARWESFTVKYEGIRPDHDIPDWMMAQHEVWFRDPLTLVHNMLSNPDLKDEVDYVPFQEYDRADNRQFQDIMSGNWAWEQCNLIGKDPNTHGSFFVPIILGSDKATVSVATGNSEFYPVYLSIGNFHNNVRCARRNGVAVIAFLAIPKTTKQSSNNPRFRKFRRQFFHSSLSRILQSLKLGTTKYDVARCCDGHFRRAIYSIGPNIADYPEQVPLCYTPGMLRRVRCGASCDQGAPDQNATPFFLYGGPGDAIDIASESDIAHSKSDIANESDIASESDITDGGELELDIGNSSESDSDTQ